MSEKGNNPQITIRIFDQWGFLCGLEVLTDKGWQHKEFDNVDDIWSDWMLGVMVNDNLSRRLETVIANDELHRFFKPTELTI